MADVDASNLLVDSPRSKFGWLGR